MLQKRQAISGHAHRLKYISVGTVLGPVNREHLVIKASLRIAGLVNRYKTSTERHSGIAYRVYYGRFFGQAVGRIDQYRAVKCVLPPTADRLIYSLHCTSNVMTLFSIQINIIPCTKPSTGFDWSVDVLPSPNE